MVCQLDGLRKCLKLDALRKALNTLPKTLDETYERILSSIDEEYYEDALKIFLWLCFSSRPMRIDEMVEVLAIESTCFSPEQRLPDPRDILTICSTMVSVSAAATNDTSTQTTGSQELMLAHFSVKEYLISDRLKNASICRYHITSSSANLSIAKTCLTYLLHFESPTILTPDFSQEFPFIRYAAEFWPWHYCFIPNTADREVVDFLGCNLVKSENSCFINWLRIFNPDDILGRSVLNLDTNSIASPLYYMSLLKVNGVLKILLNQGADVNAKGGSYVNALSAASYEGHEAVVRLLLEKGANINAQGGFYGNALSAAAYEGHEGVVRLLLEKGAEIDAADGYFGNALSAASYMGDEGLVRLLLENGANINAENGENFGNALSAAAYSGREGVVRLLLEKGAEIDAGGGDFGNALSAASYIGHEGVVRLLLEKGANVNAEIGRKYRNALSAASYKGHDERVQILLEHGANVEVRGGECGNALSAASYYGHEEVVRLLLDNGANIDAEGGKQYGNALSAASHKGHEGVVRFLLEKGADVDAESGLALRTASEKGQQGIMRILLENKADVNLVFSYYVSGGVSQEVSLDDHEAVIKRLLDLFFSNRAERDPSEEYQSS